MHLALVVLRQRHHCRCYPNRCCDVNVAQAPMTFQIWTQVYLNVVQRHTHPIHGIVAIRNESYRK